MSGIAESAFADTLGFAVRIAAGASRGRCQGGGCQADKCGVELISSVQRRRRSGGHVLALARRAACRPGQPRSALSGDGCIFHAAVRVGMAPCSFNLSTRLPSLLVYPPYSITRPTRLLAQPNYARSSRRLVSGGGTKRGKLPPPGGGTLASLNLSNVAFAETQPCAATFALSH